MNNLDVQTRTNFYVKCYNQPMRNSLTNEATEEIKNKAIKIADSQPITAIP